MNDITTIGIDLAKNVFQLHGVDARGKTVLKKQLRRKQMAEFFANLAPCLIGMEACASAHYWARKLGSFGHTVKLMAPQFVKPYVKTNKHDEADAEAICEAVARPNMRFVAIKSPDQQSILAIHRARQGFVKQRTAQANQIRGLLGEFGIVIPQGLSAIRRHLPDILEDAENELPDMFWSLIARLGEHLKALDEQVRGWNMRSNNGTARTRSAAGWPRYRALARSVPQSWWRRSATPIISKMVGNWRPGWAWYPSNTQPAVSMCCWALASVVTATCVHY
jgi:hypothetical protein